MLRILCPEEATGKKIKVGSRVEKMAGAIRRGVANILPVGARHVCVGLNHIIKIARARSLELQRARADDFNTGEITGEGRGINTR